MKSPGIGKRIIHARIDAGIKSTAALSRKLNLSVQSVWQWENDRYSPSLEHLLKLAAVLHVSPAWLLFGTNGDQQ